MFPCHVSVGPDTFLRSDTQRLHNLQEYSEINRKDTDQYIYNIFILLGPTITMVQDLKQVISSRK